MVEPLREAAEEEEGGVLNEPFELGISSKLVLLPAVVGGVKARSWSNAEGACWGASVIRSNLVVVVVEERKGARAEKEM